MIFDIVALINSGVITTVDLEGLSDELRESVDFLLHRLTVRIHIIPVIDRMK